jgi:hypothetical protein
MSANVHAFSQENPRVLSCHGQIKGELRYLAETFFDAPERLLLYCSTIQLGA